MEEMPRYVLVIVGALVLFAIYLNTTQRGKGGKAICANCESSDVVEISRETVGTRTVQPQGGGTPGGGSVRLQLDIEAKYHCRNCGSSFSRRFTETH
jgi:hypothetical protein